MAEMLENLENENTVAEAADIPEGEGVAEGGAPEITEDNLFDLVDSGEITLEEANEFLNGNTDEGAEDVGAGASDDVYSEDALTEGEEAPASDDDNGNGAGTGNDTEKPYRVFQTEEDFQRVFDNAWNKRYGKMMHERDAERTAHQDVLKELGSLLGVPPEAAAQELKTRKRRLEAEKNGVDPEEYAARAQAEEERDMYKSQLEAQKKQAEASKTVAMIRAQGDAISAQDPTFSIDEAMSNPEFAKVVFALAPISPDRAVRMAYDAVYAGRGAAGVQPAVPGNVPPVRRTIPNAGRPVPSAAARPREGGMSGMRQERRPVDYGRMSDKDILSIADRVMRGEKIEI